MPLALKTAFIVFFFFLEPAINPSGELPVTIDHQMDPNPSNNLTRNDANCDKTGTCYDGNRNLSAFYLFSSNNTILTGVFCALQLRSFVRIQE